MFEEAPLPQPDHRLHLRAPAAAVGGGDGRDRRQLRGRSYPYGVEESRATIRLEAAHSTRHSSEIDTGVQFIDTASQSLMQRRFALAPQRNESF